MPVEEIARKLAFGEAIEEQPGVVEMRAEGVDDFVGVVADVGQLRTKEGPSGEQHRAVGERIGALVIDLRYGDPGLEGLRLGNIFIHYEQRHYFAGALDAL